MSTASLPFPPLALRRLVSPVVDEKSYDNPTGDYVLGPLAVGPLAPGQAYERILDFGCGPGGNARRFLLQRNRPQSYVGVDANREMIRWCRENLGLDGFRFVDHDVWNPSYGIDNSRNRYLPLAPLGSDFTLIHANSAFIHLLQDQTEFYLREMASMLSPNGIIHARWFFFNKKWFPSMDDAQGTIFVNEHDTAQAVYYDWYYFRSLTASVNLRIVHVEWTKIPGSHNTVILAKSDRFPEIGSEIEPPRSVYGFSGVDCAYPLPESLPDASNTSATSRNVRLQQLANDLQGLQAEAVRLLAEQKFQAERIASLTSERNQLSQQYAAALSSGEQTVRIIGALRARLEEGAAERAILQSNYERSQAEYQQAQQKSEIVGNENRTLQRGLNESKAQLLSLAAEKRGLEDRLKTVTSELNRTSEILRNIHSSRAWRILSVYSKCRKAISLQGGFRRNRHLIDKSGLFDAHWYLSQYPDVQRAGLDPIEHYLRHGAAEGRDPNPYFDTDWYLSQNPDVAAAGVNPLLHYLRRGGIEQRDPGPVFHTKEYLRMHPEVAKDGLNPLAHFLRTRQ